MSCDSLRMGPVEFEVGQQDPMLTLFSLHLKLNELVVGDTSGKLSVYKNDDSRPWLTCSCQGMVSIQLPGSTGQGRDFFCPGTVKAETHTGAHQHVLNSPAAQPRLSNLINYSRK